MRVLGKRIKRVHHVETSALEVDADIELVYPDGAPSEPCYEVETMKFMEEVEERAEAMELDWLKQNGCRVRLKPDCVGSTPLEVR